MSVARKTQPGRNENKRRYSKSGGMSAWRAWTATGSSSLLNAVSCTSCARWAMAIDTCTRYSAPTGGFVVDARPTRAWRSTSAGADLEIRTINPTRVRRRAGRAGPARGRKRRGGSPATQAGDRSGPRLSGRRRDARRRHAGPTTTHGREARRHGREGTSRLGGPTRITLEWPFVARSQHAAPRFPRFACRSECTSSSRTCSRARRSGYRPVARQVGPMTTCTGSSPPEELRARRYPLGRGS